MKNEEKLQTGRPSKKRLHLPYFNIYIIIVIIIIIITITITITITIYSSSVFFKLMQTLILKFLNFVLKAVYLCYS